VNAVTLLRAEGGSSPTGTGSYSTFENFFILVEKIAYDKVVQIYGRSTDANTWNFYPASYSAPAGVNEEIWTVHIGDTPVDQFVAQYQVLGITYWDNNYGSNYLLDATAARSTDGVGTALLTAPVLVVGWDLSAAGILQFDILLQDLAYNKTVGVRFTTNNWATYEDAFATYSQSFPPTGAPHQVNAQLWELSTSIGTGNHGQFAAFYTVNGVTYWDNNFGMNYSF
jgi:Carbohydrate/starch-binding module (family 21)